MAKKKQNRQQQERSSCIPPVGHGGIQKRHQANHPPPSFVASHYPHVHNNINFQIPGYPILPFPVRLEPAGPPVSSIPLPPNNFPPNPFPPHNFAVPFPPDHFNPMPLPLQPSTLPFIYNPLSPLSPRSPLLPSPATAAFRPLPPQAGSIIDVTPHSTRKRSKKNTGGITVTLQSTGDGPVAKKTQMKYVKQMAARARKRSSIAPFVPEVKKEPGTSFNLFANVALRYRKIQKEQDAIEIRDDMVDEDDDDIVEIEPEQNEPEDIEPEEVEPEEIEEPEEVEPEEIEPEEPNDAPAANNTIVEDMSMSMVDEVGEQTIAQIEEEGERREEEAVREMEGEIPISDEDDEDEEEKADEKNEEEKEEEEEEEIVCLGEQKTKHVMSEVVILGDDDSECEIEEVDVAEEIMDKAFSEKRKSLLPTPAMEQSIIDLSLDDEDTNGKKKANTVADLPDFIPLIDGGSKKNGKGNHQQPSSLVQQQGGRKGMGGVQQTQNGASTSTHWASPLVMLTRTKSKRERKREAYRKRVEIRALEVGASPATVARAVAASTCSSLPSQFINTPSKIPLPNVAAPPTPIAHLWRCPPGSGPVPPSSSSAMGLIQSRGLSTSAHQSQPMGKYGGGIGMSGGGAPTLAAVLHDEAAGVVRDALTANGIYRRQWEEKWIAQGGDALSSSPPLDPSSAPFRICSYNVLCQKTISATSYLYRHTKFQPHVLEWSHRWPLIQKELSELNADVFGLQEIQDVHFEEYYEPFMKSLGYMCLFQRKSETIHSDGLGVFVRANRFKISSIQTVDFLVPGDDLLNRGNVAQILRLECQQTGASLIVTNTHILFNEKRGDVKLAQIALLMANIHAIRQDDEPVICLGDWNLEPMSDLYNYITNGCLDATQFVPRYGSGQVKEGRQFNIAPMRELPMDTHYKTKMSRDGVLYQDESALLKSLGGSNRCMLSHQIPLASTYAPYRERHVSTFHKDIANPDFIFYTMEGREGETESRRLRLIRRLAVPPEFNIRQQLEPWPNHCVPSDHIPLMAEFYLAK